MKIIPETKDLFSLVLRTDFSNEAAWHLICAAMQESVEGYDGADFRAYVECISDRDYEGLTLEQLIPLAANHFFMFVVDLTSLTHPERPILVVDLHDELGRTFRVIPAEVYCVQNNLSVWNMGFCEFADNVDPDGIFRGFDRTGDRPLP